MSAEAPADPFFTGALEFFRTCLASTPLGKFSDVFVPPSDDAEGAFRLAFEEGLRDFEPDLGRWGLSIGTAEEFFDRLLLAPSLQAVYCYRVSRALHLRKIPRTPGIIGSLCRLLTGIEIYYSAQIDPGLKIIHGSGCLIGAGCKIGKNFTVYQNVTVGDRLGRESGLDHRPELGDQVIAAAGAQILGPITIGARAVIGANSLVIHSVPEQCIVAGVPAKVVADLTDDGFSDYWKAIKG